MISKSDPGTSSVSKSASETFCRNLSQGIHAAAQPLAILRASLDNSYTDRMSTEELRELAANSTLEVERVCTLFSCLQQFVSIESIKPQLSEEPISPLLANLVDGVKLLFEEDGMFLNSMVPDTCKPVLINRARTLQALSSALLVAHAVSRPQETVELIASPSSTDAVLVVVRNMHSNVDALNAEQSLSMALAEANMRSQQASFCWNLQPFNVQIELPRAPLAHSL
jgi:hypothetical protein